MNKPTREPVEDVVMGCLGYLIMIGIAIGLVLAGIIWGLVELTMWIF